MRIFQHGFYIEVKYIVHLVKKYYDVPIQQYYAS